MSRGEEAREQARNERRQIDRLKEARIDHYLELDRGSLQRMAITEMVRVEMGETSYIDTAYARAAALAGLAALAPELPEQS